MSLRRLMKEATELTKSPSPDLHAAPTDDTNLYDWHFTIRGPPAPSPYSSGIYHGRITFPPTYPLRPPSFRFLTPSGRFEVNREICLSISGHHEESWQPAWGVRTALVAIRSFMDGDAKGQVGGLDVGEDVRRALAGESREWMCPVCNKTNLDILGQEGTPALDGQVETEAEQSGAVQGKPEREPEPKAQTLPESTVQPEAQTGIRPESTVQGESQPEPDRAQPVQGQPGQGHPQPVQLQPDRAQPVRGTQPVQAQGQPGQRQERDNLDTAIIVVLIALVIMIARRILNAQLDDYL